MKQTSEMGARLFLRFETFHAIALTCLNGEAVAGVREFVRCRERSHLHPIRRPWFQWPVAISDLLVVTVLRPDCEIFHGSIFERIIGLHHLKCFFLYIKQPFFLNCNRKRAHVIAMSTCVKNAVAFEIKLFKRSIVEFLFLTISSVFYDELYFWFVAQFSWCNVNINRWYHSKNWRPGNSAN